MVGPDFDIDVYINPFIPSPRLDLLPKALSWFLGYRSRPQPRIGNVLVWFWAFIGAFTGILVVEAVFMSPWLKSEGAPIIIGSLVFPPPSSRLHKANRYDHQGAAAILHYNTITSPLAQPRNAIISQLLASVLGVSITKLFQLSPHFQSLRFVAGALAVGLTSVVMGITNTIHPPAGATALLAATSPDIEKLGWFLIPLVLIGSTLMLAVACVMNNIQRQYPMYWWTPVRLPVQKREGDLETQSPEKTSDKKGVSEEIEYRDEEIVISARHVVIPEWITLGVEQRALLEVIQSQLQEGLMRTETTNTDRTRV
jgi:hypothetical protein